MRRMEKAAASPFVDAECVLCSAATGIKSLTVPRDCTSKTDALRNLRTRSVTAQEGAPCRAELKRTQEALQAGQHWPASGWNF